MESYTWIPLIIIAILNAYTAWKTAQTHTIAVETQELTLKTEQNTNGMKDQLVKAASESAHAAGREEIRREAAEAAATLAETAAALARGQLVKKEAL